MNRADENFSVDFNRRDILRKTATLGAVAAVATLSSVGAISAPPVMQGSSRAEPSAQKTWAKNKLRGIENILLPSFLPDLKAIDEEAIRIDVRNAAAQGFCSTSVFPIWIRESDPRWRGLCEVVLKESARSGILTSAGVGGRVADGLDVVIKRLQVLEAMGFSHALLSLAGTRETSADSLYDAYRRCLESTKLPVLLYANINKHMLQLGPSGIPIDVFSRLADLPNVVGVKISQPVDLTTSFKICDRVSDKLLCAPVNLDFAPLLSRSFSNIQYSGQWSSEAVQTPGKPLAVNLMNALQQRDFELAFKIHGQMQPALQHFYQLQAPTIVVGGHPWLHLKYYSWLGGGNGGLLPDLGLTAEQVPPLTRADRAKIREAFRASGLPVTDAPEEQFVVGRAAWDRGIRPENLPTRPLYFS